MKLNAPSILIITQCSNVESNLCTELNQKGYHTICASCDSKKDPNSFMNIEAIFVDSNIIKEKGWSYLNNLRSDARVPILVMETKQEEVIQHLQVFRNVSYVNQDMDSEEINEIIQNFRSKRASKVCSRWEEPLSATA